MIHTSITKENKAKLLCLSRITGGNISQVLDKMIKNIERENIVKNMEIMKLGNNVRIEAFLKPETEKLVKQWARFYDTPRSIILNAIIKASTGAVEELYSQLPDSVSSKHRDRIYELIKASKEYNNDKE